MATVKLNTEKLEIFYAKFSRRQEDFYSVEDYSYPAAVLPYIKSMLEPYFVVGEMKLLDPKGRSEADLGMCLFKDNNSHALQQLERLHYRYYRGPHLSPVELQVYGNGIVLVYRYGDRDYRAWFLGAVKPNPDDTVFEGIPDPNERSINAPVYLLSPATATEVFGENSVSDRGRIYMIARAAGWSGVRIFGKQVLLVANIAIA